MDLRTDPDSPVPLYHQIAEAIRYRISTGVLRAGDSLPTLRAGAGRWGVNLHTVRRAYATLADLGLVKISRPMGVVVLDSRESSAGRSAAGDRLSRFIHRTVCQARKQFGLSPMDFASLLTARPAGRGSHRALVVECSQTQCADLAGQLERRWEIVAEPWCLAWPKDLPEGEIVATYFHYNDIRRRWPRRLGQIHFVAIHPDASIRERVASLCRRGFLRELLICERDPMMLSMVSADLSNLFSSRRYTLTPLLQKGNGWLPAGGDKRLVLVSPRVWGGLSAEQRADPRVIEIRYVFNTDQVERLAAELEWSGRRHEQERRA